MKTEDKKRDSFLSEKVYRAKEKDSYSSLALFDESRKKYYLKFIVGEKTDDEDTHASLLGNLVDCIIFTPDEFDEKFVMSVFTRGSGQMWDFVDELWSLTLKHLSDDNELTVSITSLMEDAFNNIKFDITGKEVKFKGKDFKWLVTEFDKSDVKGYYQEKRANFGKKVVALNQQEQANNIVEDLYSTEWTSEILERQTDERYEIFNQLTVEYKIEDLPVKSMLDKVEIDHSNKNIQLYDGKVTFVGEGFSYRYRTKRYYIQAGTYHLALTEWVKQNRPDLADYEILPMIFIVADSTRQSIPLLFKVKSSGITEALNGFVVNGYTYKGVYQIVKEILWHRSQELWNISMNNFNNNGIVEISNFDTKLED